MVPSHHLDLGYGTWVPCLTSVQNCTVVEISVLKEKAGTGERFLVKIQKMSDGGAVQGRWILSTLIVDGARQRTDSVD